MSRIRYQQVLWQPVTSAGDDPIVAKDGAPWEVRLRGLADRVTFYPTESGGSGFLGSDSNLIVRNGRVEPVATPGGELWIDNGIVYDEFTTTNGGAVTGGNPLIKIGAGDAISAARVSRTIETTDVADYLTTPGASLFENTVDSWYGRWINAGNTPNSMGFAGSPTTTPATAITADVTFPFTNVSIPVADTAQLSANGGSFTLGGKRVVYKGRSTASGAGDATNCYSDLDDTGTVAAATALGNTPKAWAPWVFYHEFGRDGRPLTGSTQSFAVVGASLVPSVDDSIEAGSFVQVMRDNGAMQTQHQPVVAGEMSSVLINNWTLPDGYTAPLVGGGFRTSVYGNSYAKNVIGGKLSHQGGGWTESYDGLYQTISALESYGQVDGAIASLPTGTITFKNATKRPPTPPAGGVATVILGANPDGIGGQIVNYTGITGSGTTGTLTGCTGGTGAIADNALICNNARSLNLKDRVILASGLAIGATGWSGAIQAAVRGGTDGEKSILSITAPSNADLPGGAAALRLNAGLGAAASILVGYDNTGAPRAYITSAGGFITNGQGFIAQISGVNTTIIGQGLGCVQPGSTTARGGSNNVGSKINSGTGAPAYSAALGDIWLRTDTPSTALQRIYVCTTASVANVSSWTGIA